MSMNHFTRVIIGIVLSEEAANNLDVLNYDKYQKHLEGHSDTLIHFFRTEENRNVYIGMPLNNLDYDGTEADHLISDAEFKENMVLVSNELRKLFNKQFDVQLVIFTQWL